MIPTPDIYQDLDIYTCNLTECMKNGEKLNLIFVQFGTLYLEPDHLILAEICTVYKSAFPWVGTVFLHLWDLIFVVLVV